MLSLEDYVYHALLWKKPKDRLDYFISACPKDVERVMHMIGDVEYPKLYNTSIARYAAFVNDEDEPRGLFLTREDAWASLEGEVDARVVDVPLVELDRPQYDEYWTEVRGGGSPRDDPLSEVGLKVEASERESHLTPTASYDNISEHANNNVE